MNFIELAESLGLEVEEYMELIKLFNESGKSDLDKLQSAIDEGNKEKAAEAAHSIKGAAGNLGLMELHEAAEAIEKKARQGRLEGAVEYAQVLKNKFDVIAEVYK